MAGFGDEHQHQLHRTDEDEKRVQQQPDELAQTAKTGYSEHQGVIEQQLGSADKESGIGGSKLHRTGSSSSSSSESDGEGGRRKKGITDKIKEKLPGQHKAGETQQQGFTTDQSHPTGDFGATGTTTAVGEHGEKKGLVEKIKNKLQGDH